MPTTAKPKAKAEQGRRRTPSARPKPTNAPVARPRRKARTRPALLAPIGVIVAVFTTHLTAVAMLNYENARRANLQHEIDRTQLNIDRLRGQIAVYTDEVALRQWAEQAGMVRVDEQPELTIIGLDTPAPLPKPVALGDVEP